MSTNNSADIKSVQACGKAAINCFPKAALIEAINHLADSKGMEGDAKLGASSASLAVATIAADYGLEAHTIANGDTSTVLADWKENVRAMALELAAAGSPFAETSVNKAGDTVGKLTGTGNNVMSIAKGVVDFRLNIAECVNEDGEVSYRSVRSTVEACRAERRAQENPELQELADAKENARESWAALAKIVFGTNDLGLIRDLAIMLDTAADTATVDLEAQAELDAEIAAAEADTDLIEATG